MRESEMRTPLDLDSVTLTSVVTLGLLLSQFSVHPRLNGAIRLNCPWWTEKPENFRGAYVCTCLAVLGGGCASTTAGSVQEKQEVTESILTEFCCPLSREVFQDPVLANGRV